MNHERPNVPQDLQSTIVELTATVRSLATRLDAVEGRLLELQRAQCMRSTDAAMTAVSQWRQRAIEMTRNGRGGWGRRWTSADWARPD